MKAKIFGVAFAALLALGLVACSNMDSGSVSGLTLTAQPSTARSVYIEVGGDVAGLNNGISASVLPGKDRTTDAFKFSLSQLTCVLTGKSHLGGTASVIINPDPANGKVNLDLNAALWDLTLTAYPNTGWAAVACGDAADADGTPLASVSAAQATTPALVATASVDLRNGGQTVEFKLSAAGLTGAGKTVTLGGKYVDKDVVTDYVIGLYSISDNRPVDVKGAAITEVKNASPLTPTAGDVTFTGDFTNVAAGSYRAAVALYNSEKTQVGYWSDILVINPCVPTIKDNIVIDNLLEPPAAPEHLAAYLVPGSYDKKNDGYYQVRLVWQDKSSNENYFRIKLDRYGVTDNISYVAGTGTADGVTVYYENNTGTLCDPQPAFGADVTSLFKAQNAPTKAASDTGFPIYLSPVAASIGTPPSVITDTVYRNSQYYSPEFVDLEAQNKCGLLAGSQSVVLTLETGYIYEVKVVAHNAMGDSQAADPTDPGSDTTGTTGNGVWTEREDAGTESNGIMSGFGYDVDASDLTKYVAYIANDSDGLKGINLMSIKYLLGTGGVNYISSATTKTTGPLFKYFRYQIDTARLLRKYVPDASTLPATLPAGFDFYPAVKKTDTTDPIIRVGDITGTYAAFPLIVKQAGNNGASSVSDFSYWGEPTTTNIYDIAKVTAQNVTVLARYGSSTSGVVTIEDLQEMDPTLILAKYADSESGAETGTDINPATKGSATIETIVASPNVQWIYFAVDRSGAAGQKYSNFRFHINGNEQYAASNELLINTSEMESGTYHVLVEAYHSEYKRWFGYQFQFKISR